MYVLQFDIQVDAAFDSWSASVNSTEVPITAPK